MGLTYVNSQEWLKKQCTEKFYPELVEAKKELKRKDKEIERLQATVENYKKRWKELPFKDCSKMDPYSGKTHNKRLDVRNGVDMIVCAGSENPVKEKAKFVREYIHYSDTKQNLKVIVSEVFDDPKISEVIQTNFINKAIFRASKSEMNVTRDFVARKRMQLSKVKKSKLNAESKKLVIQISSKLKTTNATTAAHTRNDRKSRAHLRQAFPTQLPLAVLDDTIQVEHALVDTVSMIKAAVTLFYTTEELHPHWLWFYSGKHQKFLINHIKLSTFYDSTPFGKDGDACTGLYLRVLNAASLLHKPDFTFILYLLKTKEFSAVAVRCLRLYSAHLIRVLRNKEVVHNVEH